MRRGRDRALTIAKVLALAAVGVAGVLVWLALREPGRPAASESAPRHGEDISPAERRALDDILQQKESRPEHK